MPSIRKLSTYIALFIALLLLCGCGAKNTAATAGGKASPAASATAKAGQSAKPSATPGKTTAASASSHASPTSTPAATPIPTPTEPPKGTLVDGWVAGIPDYVPRFAYGKIDRSQSKIEEGSISSVFNLCFSGITRADVDAYAKALKEKGFIVAMADIGDTYTLTASLDKDWDTATLVITFTAANKIAFYKLGAPV